MAADPSYFKSVPFSVDKEPKEFLFHFYLFQHIQGQPNANEYVAIESPRANRFGTIIANDWEIRDGPSMSAKIVARAQGRHLGAGVDSQDWHIDLNIVFTEDRFKTSTLKVIGNWTNAWAVVGGTGEFAFAQGTVEHKDAVDFKNTGIGFCKELNIRVVCLAFPKSTPVIKIGPWGGKGGKEFDILAEPAPLRLESVTISAGDAISSIEFSYTDQSGNKKTVGPWGTKLKAALTKTATFVPPVIVKEVSGTRGTIAGQDVITSLTFVTNLPGDTHPFGTPSGTTFSVPLHDSNVVGFFGRAGASVDAIGIYARKSAPK